MRTRLPPDFFHLLQASSRTFNIGIRRLRPPLRDEIALAYLLLRVSDFLEDATTIESYKKAELLDAWSRQLQGGDPGSALHETLQELSDDSPDFLVAKNHARLIRAATALPKEIRLVLQSHVAASTQGMARWIRNGPSFRTEEDLDDYMFEVAGRVGHLLSDLFAIRHRVLRKKLGSLRRLGKEFGLALQTVNVIRGLPGDRFRGWIFVPREFMANHVAHPQHLWEKGQAEERIAVLGRLTKKASRHLEFAEDYIRELPGTLRSVRLFCILPYLVAVRTVALSEDSPEVFFSERKVPRTEIASTLRSATLFSQSDRWVRWYAKRLGRVGPTT